MDYLLRIVLPDQPGSLGGVASAIGAAGGDIVSLDVLERGRGGAVDDVIVSLAGGLVDKLITAAESVEGVYVESVRPYAGGHEIHRDLELVEQLAVDPGSGLAVLARTAPGVFRAGWALVIEQVPGGVDVIHRSAGAPETRDLRLPWLPLPAARRFDLDELWMPGRWRVLGTELAAAPIGRPDLAVLVGRPGGPAFRASELLRLGHLAGIAGTVGNQLALTS